MQRNTSIDGLRGMLLCILAVCHLQSKALMPYLHQPFGFVSATEGFIFLSGFMAAAVYSRYLNNPPLLRARILKRTAIIWSYSMVGVVALLLLIHLPFIPQAWLQSWASSWLDNWFEQPIATFALSVLQLHQIPYHDILIIYIIPMLFLPWVLQLLNRGHLKWVVTGSIGVWFSAQFIDSSHAGFIYQLIEPQLNIRLGVYDVFAWQLLFFAGVCVGYHVKVKKQNLISDKLWFNCAIILTALLFVYLRHYHYNDVNDIRFLGNRIAGKLNFGPVRIIDFALVAYLCAWLIRKVPVVFQGRFLVFVGQHSLPVFVFHCVLIYPLLKVMKLVNHNSYADILLSLAFVASLWIPAQIHFKYQQYKRSQQQVVENQIQLSH